MSLLLSIFFAALLLIYALSIAVRGQTKVGLTDLFTVEVGKKRKLKTGSEILDIAGQIIDDYAITGITVHSLVLTLFIYSFLSNINLLINLVIIMPSGYALAIIRHINQKHIRDKILNQ